MARGKPHRQSGVEQIRDVKTCHTVWGRKLLNAITNPLGQVDKNRLSQLLFTTSRSIVVERWRTQLIISRVVALAVMVAAITPIWGILDLLAFDTAISIKLFAGKLAVTATFVLIAWRMMRSQSFTEARHGIAMLVFATIFAHFLVSINFGINTGLLSNVVVAGYAFLPFFVMVGLGLFPLTLIESVSYSLPILAAVLLVPVGAAFGDVLATNLGTAWVLLLLMIIAAITGMTQLSWLLAFVDHAAHDLLTGCVSRNFADELFDAAWNSAQRRGTPLSVVFLDLDGFKWMNDQHGHQIGDHMLKTATEHLRVGLRRADLIVRWGGDEFVLLMPDTDVAGAYTVTKRLREVGLGERADGTAQTASFGVAERIHDCAENWRQIVHKADLRMYTAKRAGGDQVVGPKCNVPD